jgi:hypothetical protein
MSRSCEGGAPAADIGNREDTTRLARRKFFNSAAVVARESGQDQVGMPQPEAIQTLVAPVADQQCVRIAVGVAGDLKDHLAAVQAREQRHLAEQRAGAAHIEDVGAGARS